MSREKITYAKYELNNWDVVTKDGHVMFEKDIVKDLNRKSYLEKYTKDLEEKVITCSGVGQCDNNGIGCDEKNNCGEYIRKGES